MRTIYDVYRDSLALQPSLKEAACRDFPGLPWVPDAFNGSGMPTVPPKDLAQMRSICSACPHLAECRDFALSDPSIIGIWGGTTSLERRAARMGRGYR